MRFAQPEPAARRAGAARRLHTRRWILQALPVVAMLVGSTAVHADDSDPPQASVETPPTRGLDARPFGTLDYMATGAALALYYAIEVGLNEPTTATWTGPVPVLDEPLRDLTRLRTRAARETADTVSDDLWAVTTAYPVALSILAPLATGRTFDDILQLNMMNLQAYAIASILVRLPHKLIGRLRPLSRGCDGDPDYSVQCGTDAVNLSFYGGHTAISMTGAGLACAHHMHGKLVGIGWVDALGCASALTMASGVFLTRLQADKHWFSDQLLAVVVGLGVGYGLPTLFYYHPFFEDDDGPERASSVVLPMVADGQLGASWSGMF